MKEKKIKKPSDRPFLQFGFTYDDYCHWCDYHKLPSYSINSKKKFFEKILLGKLFKNKKNNDIIEDGKCIITEKKKEEKYEKSKDIHEDIHQE